MSRTRQVLMASVVIALGSSSFAVAQNADRPVLQGERNGTTSQETEIISRIDASSEQKGGYSTRQSNLSSSGGGAIYGCCSNGAGNTNPCLRANNLSAGKSFEFNATSGPVAGTITVGSGGDTKKPFTTNATGVADGLNADRVDGLNADQIVAAAREGNAALRTRWLLVNDRGQIEDQSGGFSITAGYPGNADSPANGNVYINAGEDVGDNGITATIVLQNMKDQNGDNESRGIVNESDANPEFSGEISVSQCQLPGLVACAPEAARNANNFVVSPRLSDGRRTNDSNRKRFYVMLTESSTP